MTTTAAPSAGASAAAPVPAPAPRAPFTGTGALLRFALRRDRLRLPVWLAALVVTTVSTANSTAALYDSPEARASAARTMATPAALAMTGPQHFLDHYTYGAMLSHKMIGFMGVLVGLMSVLIVTRHTRGEEETGRAELVRSTVVGRHAQLAAALSLALLANLALALLLAVSLAGLGIESIGLSGALVYGAAHAATGVVLAGVAAVTAQTSSSTRGASGLALAVIGAAYILRAAGDSGSSDALSWASPIGWAQRSYPFADDRWWPLLLCLAVAAACAATGFLLSSRRDVGAGLRPARLGRATASRALTSPFGLALRLQRGLLAGFCAGLFVMGAMYGSIIGDIEDMLGSVEQIQQALAEIGGATLAESFASMVMVVISVVSMVFVVMAVLRARAEETGGRAEALLTTGISRASWLGGHLAVALLGAVLTQLLAGLGFGLAAAAATGDHAMTGDLIAAALVHVPALWTAAGIALVLLGLLPRATALAWVVPLYAFAVGYLGEILRFPEWAGDLSPLGHVPQLPAAPMEWTPVLVLTLVAAALCVTGIAGFRHRDLETE
ncbi:ABC transporter permease [Streptomyces fragilis]|uniref:ABC transporter permease n=1 Tax=Streptomyces fragilis TaxID=67301 RepID=A0ABV2YQZ4_9ACTN|nr:ABC transporter permease [Streptomyces fragilis]